MSFSQCILLVIWLLAFAISVLLVAHLWWSVHVPDAPKGYYKEIYDLAQQTAGLYAFVLTTMFGVAYARTQPKAMDPPIRIREQLTPVFWTALLISLAWNALAIFFLSETSFWQANSGREINIRSLRELLQWFEKLGWVVNPFIAFYFAHDRSSQ